MSNIQWREQAFLKFGWAAGTEASVIDEFFSDMMKILQGDDPVWRVERDASIRGWVSTASSWFPNE